MGHGIASSLATADQHSGQPGFADNVLSARVELYACLQLLADRARFITGATWAAIALHEDNDFVYCAAAGTSTPVIGSTLDVKNLHSEHALAEDGKSLLVGVNRESKAAGFFQLSTQAQFSNHDLQAIIRLAEMVSTAIDCMEAEKQSMAEHSASTIPMAVTTAMPMAVAPLPKPAIPVLWHAPESVASAGSIEAAVAPTAALSVYTCESCGFPVSRGRKICVDCEERGIPSADNVVRLFAAREKQEESWISAHGYTIASILVSALVFAIIYWLR